MGLNKSVCLVQIQVSYALMLYKTLSAAVYGIDASIIEVEVDVSGIKTMEDHFHTVGLPDAAVRESRDRVRAALKNCGYDLFLPPISPLILLPRTSAKKAPASTCLWLWESWARAEVLNKKELPDCLFVGELSLDGGVRGVRGATSDRHRSTGQKDFASGRA